MTSSSVATVLTTVYDQLTAFAGLDGFWRSFAEAFGSQYDPVVAQSLRSQWQDGNFSQLPTIQVIDDEILGNAWGAYASSTNVIYLSDVFVATATCPALEAVLIEEIGHFVDAQVNSTDTAGDEGELFSAIVRGVGLSTAELSRIKTENDHAVVMINGQATAIEMALANGVISFSGSQFSVNEDGTPITQITLTRTGGSTGVVSVTLNLTDGTATAGKDYLQTPITVTFADGETSKTVNLIQASQGLSFDGISNTVNNYKFLTGVTDTFTMEFWANPTATRNSTAESNLYQDFSGIGGQRYAIFPVQGEVISGAGNAGAGVSVGTNGISVFEHSAFYIPSLLVYDVPLSGWNHIAIVYQNKTPSLYLNGQFIKTGLTSNYIVHPSFQLGDSIYPPGVVSYGAYQGSLDDVRIWSKARTQTEIQADFNRELKGNETGLVSYWNLNSVNGNIVQDLTSSRNDGTLSGAQSMTGLVPTSSIIDDTLLESNETINLTLTNPTGGATLGSQQTATLTIVDNEIINIINGTASNDNLVGTASFNQIDGKAGNDTLTGGSGIDTLIGGLGNDTYIVDTTTDTITENPAEGTDTIRSSVTFFLASFVNIENLTLTGNALIDGTGNGTNNTLIGNTANNSLAGGAGNDTLNGGAGTDTLIGGLGNDTYQVDTLTDTITENMGTGEGTDTIQSSITFSLATLPNIENLTLTGNALIDGTGNGVNNLLIGNTVGNSLNGAYGNDTLNGGAGIDTLIGGVGNDVYIVDTTTDVITENVGEGTDTIQSSVTFTLATLPNIENLTLTGAIAVNGTGNTSNNVLTGNTGNNSLNGAESNDTLNGGTGVDTLIGGIGDDVYVVDTITDVITENVGEGTDTIQSSVTFTLATLPNIENLTLTGAIAVNGTGNTANNILTGNTGSNNLNGDDGNDTLNGGTGIDTLVGGTGDDLLIGAAGKDNLTGGLGVDRFSYKTLTDSLLGPTDNFDVITDFNANAGNDLFLVATARTGFTTGLTVATLNASTIGTALTTTNFAANAAAQFTFTSGLITRTFIAINNATAGFSATTDAIVEVTGLTGTIGLANFAIV